MDLSQVTRYLDSYKQVPAMITAKKLQIADLEERLKFARENRCINHEPGEIRVKCISKPTENKAVMDIDGSITPAERDLMRRIKNCRADLHVLEFMPKYVDTWLGGLLNRERVVVELRHFDHLTFEQIGDAVGFEKTTIKRVYRQAMGKIENMTSF